MIKNKWLAPTIIAVMITSFSIVVGGGTEESTLPTATLRPALSVNVIQPETLDIPLTLTANGSIAAWQEAIIGAEVNNLRLKEVRVDVGESVRKGQVLAVFSDESVLADVEQSKATLAEADATLAEARLNASRARQVSDSGALSDQQISQYLTSEKTALAKVASAKAQLNNQLLRQRHTRVIASDDGIISLRKATLGAVPSPSEELFRLIRQHRLEWRAEVTAAEMAQLHAGIKTSVHVPNVASIDGKIRFLAPTLDVQSRNGIVYVDLTNATRKGLRAGMFAEGEFYLGSSTALTVPQEALSLREGFSYVFRLGVQVNGQAQVTQVKVELGRRSGDRFEIVSGISPQDKLVASGAAFLANGDAVKVVSK